ncbi:hypothetical protein [Thioclava sp. F28-4]|uniref:hypothetical protein n=1 Tax=Thioclava sp. F28-4 TaxID=1915315 RepID=UPI000995E48F|nr:hypothetical protein [Thioclava sp. F28-4]OOY02861.1 hypothetical protein BMI87_20620 [Thioclava sp. F28-4]
MEEVLKRRIEHARIAPSDLSANAGIDKQRLTAALEGKAELSHEENTRLMRELDILGYYQNRRTGLVGVQLGLDDTDS